MIDFSCADEVVAKLLHALRADDRRSDAYFLFRGVTDDHWDAIEAVLERHGLALALETTTACDVVGRADRRRAARVGRDRTTRPRRRRRRRARIGRRRRRRASARSTRSARRRLVMRVDDEYVAVGRRAVDSDDTLNRPLRVAQLIATRAGDAERGPMVVMNPARRRGAAAHRRRAGVGVRPAPPRAGDGAHRRRACARRRRAARHRRRLAVGDRARRQAGSRHARTPSRPRSPERALRDAHATHATPTRPRDARRPRRHRGARRGHAGRARRCISRSTSFRRSAPAKGCAIRATATRRTPSWCSDASPRSRAPRRRCCSASGMGATACALLALLRPGDHLLASSWIYGGAHALLTKEFAALGIEVTLVDPIETRVWRQAAAQGDARDLPRDAGESDVPRARPAAGQLHHEGERASRSSSTRRSRARSTSVRSSTAPTSSFTRRRSISTAITTCSAASCCGTASYIEEVRQKMMLWGQAPDPFAAGCSSADSRRSTSACGARTRTRCAIAEWCAERKEIRARALSRAADHPDHEVAKATDGRLRRDDGDRAGRRRRAPPSKFLRKLRIIRHAPSLGGVDSLVSEPRFTSHAHLSAEERARSRASRTASYG